MKSEYLKYNLEELLEDKQFLAWVLRKHNNNEWNQFIENNPEFTSKVKKAREIISLLSDTHEVLDEESVLEMWKNIDRFQQLQKQKRTKLHFRKDFTWAASIVLIISLGTLGYFFINEKQDSYQFAAVEAEAQGKETRLVLSNGEEIALNKDNSTVALGSDNKLTINNDTVIDLSQRDSEATGGNQMNEVVVPFGKKSELQLADGTKVWLNAGSRLAFPSKFTKKSREVFLEGEAYFEVAKKQAQPFIVNAAKIEIKVLGTHFNVSAYPADQTIETVLLEGSVALSRPNSIGNFRNEVVLQPNQKGSFSKEQREVKVTDEPDVDLYVAWTYGWLKYNKESLGSVLGKVERYYNIEIQIPENYPKDDKITGKLDLKDSLERVMVVLADATGFAYRISGNKVFIDKEMKIIPR
jgi:ferric-dicitrate binding protein FerR (iron transport regulator)